LIAGVDESVQGKWIVFGSGDLFFDERAQDPAFDFVGVSPVKSLNEVEAGPGSLIEKEITTPEYYPLSLNALVNACIKIDASRHESRRIGRPPGLHSLMDISSPLRQRLGQPVTKYEHRLQEAFNF